MQITSISGTIPVHMPGATLPIKADIRSDVCEGLTITIPTGPLMFQLHEMIAAGELLEVSFTYRPSERE